MTHGFARTLANTALAGSLLMLAATGMAGARDEQKVAQQAAAKAQSASAALSARRFNSAVDAAEAAVALRPREASYRALLGQSYLRAGRFTSAQQALGDALSLQPGDGKVALSLALAQVAGGKWDAARETLRRHGLVIPAADRGLAMALAGDPDGGVDVLVEAARRPDANAKTRQNLALAFALAGRWAEARTMVSQDMSPDDVDSRIEEWAVFAHPAAAWDQVASLLDIHPVKDAGQPVALALVAPAPMVAAAAAPEPVAAASPVPAAAPSPAPAVAAAAPTIKFAAASAVVQPLPERVQLIAAPGPFKAKLASAPAAAKPAAKPAATPAKAPAKGDWFVQLGAFDSAAVARDSWARVTRRHAAFAGQVPAGMSFTANGTSFYRLSVGGFARADAAAMCRSYRARGGNCFVRQGAGDQVAAWVKPAVQVAAKAAPVKVAAKAQPVKVAAKLPQGRQLASR